MLEALGVQPELFKLLVRTKFLVASREQGGIGQLMSRPGKVVKRPLLMTFLFNLLVGVFLALLISFPMPLAFRTGTFLVSLFLMFFLSMLTGFATTILDPKDRRIFGVRGVSDRTINAARLTVVTAFLGMSLLALAGPGVAVMVLQNGLRAGLAVLVSALLLGVMTLLLALLTYVVILRFFDGERLKNGLNVVQIGMTVLIYLAGQLPNLLSINHIQLGNISLLSWWSFLVPPLWFLGVALVLMGTVNAITLALSAVAVGGLVLLVVGYWRFSPQFERNLEKLDQANQAPSHTGWYLRLTRRLFTASEEEAAYFTLGWRMTAGERDFKLRVLPQFAYALMLPAILIFTNLNASPIAITNWLRYVPLLLFSVVPLAVVNLRFSSHPEAMQVVAMAPVVRHGLIYRGVLMALYARLLLPLVILLGLAFALISSPLSLVTMLLNAAFLWAVTLLMGQLVARKGLPFSEAFTVMKGMPLGAIGTIFAFAGLALVAGIAIAGVWLSFWWFDAALTLGFTVFGWLLWRLYPDSIHYQWSK